MSLQQEHILVLGATGPSGIAFVEEALNAGHRLTLYVRTPTKIPSNIQTHENVSVIKGTFEDWDAIEKALYSGATALVSFVGPIGLPPRGTPITAFYEKLFPKILEDDACMIKRCLCLTTPSFRAPEDRSALKWWLIVAVIRLLGGDAYNEVTGIGKAISSLPTDRMKWTLFRVPLLTSSEAKPTNATMLGDAKNGILCSRKSIAVWVLQELKDEKWVGKAPALSNPGWI